MAQISIRYNPYRLYTEILVDGNELPRDSKLYNAIKDKRLQEWVTDLPSMLRNQLNSRSFEVIFHGTELDFEDLQASLRIAKDQDIISEFSLKFEKTKKDYTKIQDAIVKEFRDLQEGPVDAFRAPSLTSRFEEIKNSYFPINVVATMSSGKSTIINALLSAKLMPSKSEACTALVTHIKDNDADHFEATAFDAAGSKVESVSFLTYEKMDEWNSNGNIFSIDAIGDIPFIDANDSALELIDTPGPNNSQDSTHRDRAYACINNANNLILYVLNATQLSTNDDDALLSYVSEQIKRGGKQARDRFLFVINKMDCINLSEDKVDRMIDNAIKYLEKHGIYDPQIFPLSAFTALNIRTYLKDIDPDTLSRADERKLPDAAQETLSKFYKFIDNPEMHFERYSSLAPNEAQKINDMLMHAIEQNDTKMQVLIHSGIVSLEEAIRAYVKKYAKTKKIKDLVDTFDAVLEQQQVYSSAKQKVAESEKAAEELKQRRQAIEAKLTEGKDAEQFRKRIDTLDPIEGNDGIRQIAETLYKRAVKKARHIFEKAPNVLTSEAEAKNLIAQFNMAFGYAVSELITELNSSIETKVVDVIKQMVNEYVEKLTRIDETVSQSNLGFNTADLIKDKLDSINSFAGGLASGEYSASDILDKSGAVEKTEKTVEHWEKVGTETFEVKVGSHEEVVGTKQVKVGSHKEKVGTKQVAVKRKGLARILDIFSTKYETQDVFEMVDDWETQEIVRQVDDYETRTRDKFEKREEKVTVVSITTGLLASKVVTPLTQKLKEQLDEAVTEAANQVKATKQALSALFDQVDEIIKKTYKELDSMSDAEKNNVEELEKNKKVIEWLDKCRREIDELLDI